MAVHQPGWLDEMTAWIDGCLGDAGIRRRSEPTLVRSWSRAVVLKIATDRGPMWAKAVPEAMAQEVEVTMLLSDIDPGIVPPVVAANPARGRVITEHVEGPVLASVDAAAPWTATLSRLAEIQRVLATDTAALTAAGVVAAPLTGLAAAIPGLLDDDDLLRVGRDGGLSADEVGRLRARTSELVDACRALAASGVPDSLEHGDLSASQVIVGEMGPVILDWSDGSMTHPFLSAASFLSRRRWSVARGAAPEPAIIDAYLAPWLESGAVNEVDARHALDVARTVEPLHVAALYARHVLPVLGRPDDLATVVPNALRSLL